MTTKKKPSTNVRSAGQRARTKIIEVSMDLFGQYGFSGVSVRQICEQAKVNIGAINYHFGGKEKLYDAVDEYISEQFNERLSKALAPARDFVISGGVDPEIATKHLLDMHTLLIRIMIPDSDETERWAKFCARTELGERVPERTSSIMEPELLVVKLIGICRGDPDNMRMNGILAAMFVGQILVFRTNRTTAKKLAGVDSFDEQEINDITRIILNNIQSTLSVGEI